MEGVFQENNFTILMVIGILIMLSFAMAFVFSVNYLREKILKEQMDNQELAYQHQEELLHNNILTQEAERKRIARDLHDEIGSKLNIIFLNIYRLKEISNIPEDLKYITDEIEEVINTTITSIRLISHELLPPTLEDFGFVETVRELQHRFNRLAVVHIDFNVMEDESPINDSLLELNLFRILQELINNSIKHGKCTEIEIQLWITHDTIKLVYQDNGIGFEITNFENKKGLGMKNIESRLRMIKATHTYNSSPRAGMQMTIESPNQQINEN